MVLPCSCSHKFQDSEYGKGQRVHNSCVKGYRCTVCGNITGAGLQAKEEKKETK
jgi:hypothetical protein